MRSFMKTSCAKNSSKIVQSSEKLWAGDGCGADFSNDDTSGVIGDDCGFLQHCAGCKCEGQGRNDGVSGAGYIEYLARDCGDMDDGAGCIEQAHSMFASCDQHVLAQEHFADSMGCAGE